EIKPFTPTGVRDGLEKLALFRVSYPAMGFPYRPGTIYIPPPREILMRQFVTDGGENLDVLLVVVRPVPGLLFYQICVRGDFVLYFNRVRVIAGALAILAALAAEALAAAEGAAVIALIQELAVAFGVTLPVLTPR